MIFLRQRQQRVVDNGSTDDTLRIVHEHERLRYVYEPRAGLTIAKNAGIARAHGEILVFVDDDMTLGPTWLQEYAKAYEGRPDVWLIGGRTRLRQEDVPSWYRSRANMPPAWWLLGPACEYGDVTIQLHAPQYVAGNNMSCRRAVIVNLGGFCEDIGHKAERRGVGGEDHELCRRVYDAGGSIYYCADAVAWHPIPPERCSLKAIRGFAFIYGRELFIDQQRPPFSLAVAAKDSVKSITRYARRDFGGGLSHELDVRRAFGYFYQRWMSGRPYIQSCRSPKIIEGDGAPQRPP
jgi:GT2 family glycosyltransferase